MEITKVTFLAMIDDGASALKCSGSGNGGKLVLAFDDSQLPEAIKSLVLRKQLLSVTLEPEDDYSD